jgi:hypothetical protein
MLSESEAISLFSITGEHEILRRSPQDDIATQYSTRQRVSSLFLHRINRGRKSAISGNTITSEIATSRPIQKGVTPA